MRCAKFPHNIGPEVHTVPPPRDSCGNWNNEDFIVKRFNFEECSKISAFIYLFLVLHAYIIQIHNNLILYY